MPGDSSTGLSAAALPVSLLKPLALPGSGASTFQGVDEATKRTQIDAKSKEFEQNFLSIMFGQMFQGTTRTLFGGGAGEEAFTGFLTDAMAKSVEKHGGVGLAKTLSAEMLKMQGLSQTPGQPAPSKGVPGKAASSPSATAPASAQAPAQQLDIAA